MEQLPQQISSAVAYAVSPSTSQEQRNEAYTFLQQVKDAHQETWAACLNLFLADGNSTEHGSKAWSTEARMFGIQVVGESLPGLSPEALAFVQSSLFEYFAKEYVEGPAENGVAYLKNASLHLTTLLFLQVYPTASPAFLTTFLAMLKTPGPELNPATTDLLLRLLHEVSLEISDAQLRLNKPSGRLQRDGELRDAVRERDAPAIASAVWEIVAGALEGMAVSESPADSRLGLKGKTAREISEMAIKVAGDYVSWIDINLMVTPTSIPLLLRALNMATPETAPVRIAAADTLLETVLKGMPATDKLALLGVLDIGTVLASLLDQNTGSSEEFREKLGKVLNGAGCELCKIQEDQTSTPEARSQASVMVTALLPLLLRLLSDSHDETACAVFPFAQAVLGVYKKEKKRAGPQASALMTVERRLFLTELLKATVQKMEYAQDAEWTMGLEGEEDDEALQFAEMRKSLRLLGDAVAALDPELYADAIRSIIVATMDLLESGAAGLTWQRVELSLALLYSFGQAIAASGPAAFVQVPDTEVQREKREAEYRIDYTQYPLSQLGEMMLRACRSKVVAYNHAAVSLQFFEVAVRYSEFFKLCPEYIQEILPSFLDEHGLHQDDEAVQARVFYLFSRFIYQAKQIIQAQVSGELISQILGRMQDLLVVKAELSSSESPSEAILTKAASSVTVFDSQLYLFEAVGTLISILNQIPDQQVVLLRAVLGPLAAELQGNVRTTAASLEDYQAILQAHHLMMAAGNVAKGFPDLSMRNPAASGAWVQVFREVTEQILTAAKAMDSYVIIRDAARFAFNRIVATTGQAVLPLIPTLIDCLIGQITFPELAELLSFTGLLVAKYKTAFTEILDTLLLPLLNRVFNFLESPIAGTDDAVQHSQLRRAYFNFILSITAANMQEVFYSEKNKEHLQQILQSIHHYIATDSQAPEQRFGFIVLNKLVSLWVESRIATTSGSAAATTNGATSTTPVPSPVPGFEQYLYSNAIKLCFEVPLQARFDFADAQSFQVLGEMANFLKALLVKRGTEFTEFMQTTFFPSIQCPLEASRAFMTALQEATDGKQFKKFFVEWLRQMRGPRR